MNSISSEEKARLMKLATYASTSVALTLIICKMVAWLMTDSVSLMATLIDSCLDALASIINLVAVRHALAPADKQHRFGHGKAEALAGLGQATFITGSALFLLLEAISHFWNPQPISEMPVGVAIMVVSIVATYGLMMFQQHVINKTDSTAIKADRLHYKTDLLVNGSVIIALLLAYYGWAGFDPLFALLIAGYILYSAWEIVQESLGLLMDREMPDEDRQKIKAIVRGHPKALGMHDLRTRTSGMTIFIQLHLELDDSLTLMQAHTISDEVEALLLAEYPGAEIIIHEDPASLVEQHPEFAE
ncbi:cation diffusion facilitator family transporter [Mariprofundus sp. NF]|uniref:cation diffusion facilitator family transporter n=1 Tax=Mariprofundus sp. NF TaxID=2608716 RepID=UPI0015A07C66|nr:cation diffusion facilitator family transporter [Mariprofundus sp. NF]NWF37576.1 cation diffusion facilitator family transporter [Mariprofundus sp. NF]